MKINDNSKKLFILNKNHKILMKKPQKFYYKIIWIQ